MISRDERGSSGTGKDLFARQRCRPTLHWALRLRSFEPGSAEKAAVCDADGQGVRLRHAFRTKNYASREEADLWEDLGIRSASAPATLLYSYITMKMYRLIAVAASRDTVRQIPAVSAVRQVGDVTCIFYLALLRTCSCTGRCCCRHCYW